MLRNRLGVVAPEGRSIVNCWIQVVNGSLLTVMAACAYTGPIFVPEDLSIVNSHVHGQEIAPRRSIIRICRGEDPRPTARCVAIHVNHVKRPLPIPERGSVPAAGIPRYISRTRKLRKPTLDMAHQLPIDQVSAGMTGHGWKRDEGGGGAEEDVVPFFDEDAAGV